jgi:hypothetical protein
VDTEQKEARNEVTAELPFVKWKFKGDNLNLLLTFVTCIISVCLTTWVWTHMADMSSSRKELVQVLKDHADGQNKMVQAVKENTCILAQDQERRTQEFNSPNGLCKRLSQQ